MLTQNVKIARHGRIPTKSILAPDIPAQIELVRPLQSQNSNPDAYRNQWEHPGNVPRSEVKAKRVAIKIANIFFATT